MSCILMFQTSVLKKFPAELIVVFYYCFFVTLQSGIVCLVVEIDLSAWSFKPDVKLVAVVYSVVFGSAFQIGVSTSLVGAIVIVSGFYSVMWGKTKEGKVDAQTQGMRLESSSQKVALLSNNTGET
ncbi:hypothetical protein CRYUN_Cryun29cG0047200 [Craigia yunnanensis]